MNLDQHRPGWFCPATFRWLALLAVLVFCQGCGHREPDDGQTSRQSDQTPEQPGHPTLRIVSLSPAISRTLVDLGLGQFVVGRTPFCDSLPDDVPIVGDLFEIDHETLVRLAPTHLCMQPPAAGPDPALLAMAGRRDWVFLSWHLNGVRDIEQMVRDLRQIVPQDVDAGFDEVRAHGTILLAELGALSSSSATQPWSGRVLVVESIDPVLAFGTDTYLGQMLAMMGCPNAMQRTGWVELSMEDVVRMQPDAIIIVESDATQANEHRARLEAMQIDAVSSGRVGVLDNPDALLPSSAIVDVARALEALLTEFGESER